MKQYSRKIHLILTIFAISLFLLLSGWWSVRPAYAGARILVQCAPPNMTPEDRLAQAIEDANSLPGRELIEFQADAEGNCEILLSKPLPYIEDDLYMRGMKTTVVLRRDPDAPAFRILLAEADLTLENFTITGGKQAHSTSDGGGIYAQKALTLTNVAITDNSAQAGGGIYVHGPLTMKNVLVSGNKTSSRDLAASGGGIYADSAVTAVAITVTHNMIGDRRELSYGGGIYVGGNATISQAIFSENKNDKAGAGALYVEGELRLSDSLIYSNSGDYGSSAIYVEKSATIRDSRFFSNTGFMAHSGAIYIGEGGTGSTIEHSHFSHNIGGAIISKRPLIVNSSYFTANVSSGGAGVNAVESSVTIDNCYFVDNRSPETEDFPYGAVAAHTGTVQNSVFIGNSAVGTRVLAGGGAVSIGLHATIQNNLFIGNQSHLGGAVYILSAPGAVTSSIINNVFINNDADQGAAIAFGLGHEQLSNGIGSIFHNTIVHQTKGNGSAISIAGGDARIHNNIIANYAIGIVAGFFPKVTSNGNLLFGNTLNYQGVIAGTEDVTADPLFVDAANQDFRLQPDSPAKDSGLDVGIFEDFDRVPRPQEKGFDRGAFEHIPSNVAPVANPDNYSTTAESLLTVVAPGLLANDADADGDPVVAQLVTPVAVGDLTVLQDGSFTYQPEAGFTGTVTFTYSTSDGKQMSTPAVVTIIVAAVEPVDPPPGDEPPVDEPPVDEPPVDEPPVDEPPVDEPPVDEPPVDEPPIDEPPVDEPPVDEPSVDEPSVDEPPVIVDDQYSTQQNTPLAVAAPGVLENDTLQSANLVNAVLEAVLESSTQQGTLTLNGDGSFVYTPNAGFTGEDSFTYRARTGEATSEIATVTIVVTEGDPDEGETYQIYFPHLIR